MSGQTKPTVAVIDERVLVSLIEEAVAVRISDTESRLLEAINRLERASPEQDERSMFTVKGLAEHLSCDQRTVHRWWRSGVIPRPLRVGNSLRWDRATIESWRKTAERATNGIMLKEES